MIGPRTCTVHPNLNRGARLHWPLLAALVLSPLACTDQPTAPASPRPSAVIARPHPYHLDKSSKVSMSSVRAPVSFSVVGLSSSSVAPTVLILSDIDGPSTTGLATSLANAGFGVTLRPAPEYTWDGTDPALDGFKVVIHLNGNTYFEPLPAAAQSALNSFVQAGGGFVGAQWNQYELSGGQQSNMPDLVLQGFGTGEPTENCAFCRMTFTRAGGQEDHPVLAGIPEFFAFTADGHEASPATAFESSPSTVLMQVPSGAPGVLVRVFGSGKVVNFSFAPNDPNWDMDTGFPLDPVTLADPNVERLYINAVRWASGLVEAQTINFGTLTDRTFGDPAFAVNASASSGLAVSFSATGSCAVDGSTVSLTGAGTCTVTAHQAGNEAYQAAADVAQSFAINPAVPTIHWTPPVTIALGTPLMATDLNATATGVAGANMIAAQATLTGTWAYTPPAGTVLPAGTHSITARFTPDDPNYTVGTKTVQVTVAHRFSFKGFYSPVRNMPARNRMKAGRAVTLKFSIGGNYGYNIVQTGSPTSRSVACDRVSSERTLEGTRSSSRKTSRNNLYYNRGSGRYEYVWRTDHRWAGTCRVFSLTLVDGTTHEAQFRFVKQHGGDGDRDRDDDD
jgi:hypothetical protein